jgi:type IV fimbrial biogenesis protein FimT
MASSIEFGADDKARNRRAADKRRGFSLIELLVVIAIAGILLGIGVPNLRSFIVSNRLTTAANEVMAALQLARSEATRRGVTVILRTNGAAGSGDFSAGWQLFADANGNGAIDAGELVRAGAAIDNSMSLRASTSTFGTDIAFDASGRSVNGSGVVVVCLGGVLVDGTEPRSRAIIVDRGGRVRQAALSSNHKPVGDNGAELTSCSPS